MNTPDWTRWDLNSCFDAFRTIWVHLVLFGCLTKLGAKQAKLGQKFVPRSRVGIFCHERTRYTPLDSKHIFCCVLYYLNAYFTTLSAKWAKLVEKFVPRSRIGIFRNERTRSTPLDPKLKILVHFILIGCWDCLVAFWNSVQNVPN